MERPAGYRHGQTFNALAAHFGFRGYADGMPRIPPTLPRISRPYTLSLSNSSASRFNVDDSLTRTRARASFVGIRAVKRRLLV